MPEKDLHEDLIRFYEFQMGQLPHRQAFKRALQTTFSQQDLRIFFLLPFLGQTTMDKLEKKAARAGIPAEVVRETVGRLIPAGIVDSYVTPAGRICGRAPVIALLEFQVCLDEESPMRAVCTQVMNDWIEGKTQSIPTRTPYYRVLPVEATLTGTRQPAEIALNAVVPDPRQVLPIDVISEMLKKESLIVVADCYCRSTKNRVGEGCSHPLETCFYFNELGMVKLEAGYGRRIGYDEAIGILRHCEESGLVHNVSNCEGKIQTLCNCCACSCGVLKAVARGQRNIGAPARFVVEFREERCNYCAKCLGVCNLANITLVDRKLMINVADCIGCGQCISHCPEGALRLSLRERPPRIYPDNDALFRRINLEAMGGLVLRKIRGQ
jgi:NAD-dependent dihydropyrimidine dehydrogenase PreA subunit